jgi:hypothetical protein
LSVSSLWLIEPLLEKYPGAIWNFPSPSKTTSVHADFNKAAARINVVVGELLLHLTNAQSVGDELVGIDAHLVLAHRASEIGNVHNIRNELELLEQNPIFDPSEFH